MTLVLGIDPGASGAMAIYDSDTRRLVGMYDIPTWNMTVGKKKRKRVDAIALAEKFEIFEMLGVELVVLETVNGLPGQSASAAFAFGYTFGLLYMGLVHQKFIIEGVRPATWKKIMNVPGKMKGSDDDIMNRADELFPHDRHLFRGPKGGKKLDRAEAAMMAKFGADVVLPTMGPYQGDEELYAIYRKVEGIA